MKTYLKLLLTISYLLSLIYTITFFNVDFFRWITNNVLPYEYQTVVVNLIYLPALVYLIYRIWTFKNINKNMKGNWTVFLIFVGIITMPIYIWKKDDDFIEQNSSLNPK